MKRSDTTGRASTWKVDETVDEVTSQRVAEHVIAYLNAQAGWWVYRPPAVVALSFLFLVVGGQVIGSVMTIAYTTWVVRFWAQRLGTIVDLVNVLGPALQKVPSGLDEVSVTSAVFSEAQIAGGGSRRARLARLGAVTKEWFGSSGKGLSYDCSNGHGPICGHRTPVAARDFWTWVARSL